MLDRLGFIVGLLCLTSVVFAGDAPPPVTGEELIEEATQTWRERRLAFGQEVYEYACAACHDEGLKGAPAIGDRESWESRSPLWSAVLFEHARTGYLEMPVKGSHPELTDQEVDAASEYLLSKTFPEMPLD